MQNSENKTIFIFSTKNKISWIEGMYSDPKARKGGRGCKCPQFLANHSLEEKAKVLDF